MQEMRKNPRLIRGLVGLGIAAAVIGLDQLTKYLVAANMEIGQSVILIPGVLRLTYITNPAAAMGMFGNARWLFMILSPLVTVGILAYLFAAKSLPKLYTVALSMIAGGGLGNMIDRTFYGQRFGYGEVVDFVDFIAFPKIWGYIFNVADIFVCVGAGLLILGLILDMIRESAEKKKKTAARAKSGAPNAPNLPNAPILTDAHEITGGNAENSAEAGEESPKKTESAAKSDPNAPQSGENPENPGENGVKS